MEKKEPPHWITSWVKLLKEMCEHKESYISEITKDRSSKNYWFKFLNRIGFQFVLKLLYHGLLALPNSNLDHMIADLIDSQMMEILFTSS